MLSFFFFQLLKEIGGKYKEAELSTELNGKKSTPSPRLTALRRAIMIKYKCVLLNVLLLSGGKMTPHIQEENM